MNRRTVLTAALAAVWGIPVVEFAAAAPAFATSVTPELVCTPKGNRSHRNKGAGKSWDYHLAPGCTADVKAVWIGDREAAAPHGHEKRWTVTNLGVDADRVQPVRVLAQDGSTWAGGVRFS